MNNKYKHRYAIPMAIGTGFEVVTSVFNRFCFKLFDLYVGHTLTNTFRIVEDFAEHKF